MTNLQPHHHPHPYPTPVKRNLLAVEPEQVTKKRPSPPMKHNDLQKPSKTRLPIFDTMTQCRSATGIPISAIRLAKAGGCDAFKHGRIDLALLLHWIFSKTGDEPDADWGSEWK